MDIYLLTDSLALDGAGQKIKDTNEDMSLLPKIRAKPTTPNVAVSSLRDTHTEHK